MPGLAAYLPDATVGLPPVPDDGLDLPLQDGPDPLVQTVPRAGVDVEGVEDRAPDVVLTVPVGGVADPDGLGSLVPGEMVENVLVQLSFAVDAVHDLEFLVPFRHVGDEPEEVVGLPVEAQRVQAPEGEGRVPDPGVAVVPVAVAARGLGAGRWSPPR
ncbi:hypothetical protein GCM10018952_09610 [Streptosporangium vulgare]